MSYADRAGRYAKDVADGRILACKWTRLACQRYLDDLSAQGEGFEYWFDADAADAVCGFVELMPHVKGEWARPKPGQPAPTIELEDWQCFFLSAVFGWKRENGTRRYRKASLYVPRKNAKSTLAAAIGNYMFTADDEPGAEVYSGATTEYQAWEVFGPARLMAKKTEPFTNYFGVDVNAKTMARPGDASRFHPIVGKPGDGASPHCAIVDEYHEHKTAELYDTMLTGMGARQQPLLLVITTAGDSIDGPCYDDFRTCQKILDGTVDNDEHFGLIYTVDEDDAWDSDEALAKANPNMGVSVSAEFLRARRKEAVQNARNQTRYKTKHLNVWVTARDAYYNMHKWNNLTGFDPAEVVGQPCVMGADLASKVDIAALQWVFFDNERREVRTFGRYYLPESALLAPSNDHYRAWAEEGHLTITPGDMIDLQRIRDDIIESTGLYQVEAFAYDPHQATLLVSELMDEGVPCVEWRQTVLTMSEPMKESDALIRAGRLQHDGNPVMTWMMGNVTARVDAKDNVYPRKERPENKIDGPVALIMAMGAMQAIDDPTSVYEYRDMRVL